MQSPLPFRPGTADSEWIGGRYRLPGRVRDGDVVVEPEIILWLELPQDIIVGTTLVELRRPVSVADSLREAMEKPVHGPPRRPVRIRVASESVAAELRATAEGIEIVVAPVPELDAAFAEFAAQMEEPESSYLGDGRIAPEVMGELFKVAEIFFRTRPWKHVHDHQIIRVDIPRLGIDAACLSVIGAAGKTSGLLLFRSIDDYHRFSPAEDQEWQGDPDGPVALRSLSFFRKKDLSPSMLREIEQHGWPVAGANAYPMMLCLDEEWAPIPDREQDVHILTACTRAFLAFYIRNHELFMLHNPEPVSESSRGDDDVVVKITAPFTLPQRRSVGRNDPCPCGSGRKYKKCHLDTDREPQRAASRAESIHQMNRCLVHSIAELADRIFGPEWFDDTLYDDEASMQLAFPWAAWTATVDGKRVADAFLERHGARLSDEEREWFDAQRRAWLSIFEVVKVEPGLVAIRDLLTHEEHVVREVLASKTLVPRDVLLARLLEFRGASLFGGMYGRYLPPSDAAEVVDAVRAKLRLRKRNVPIERLQNPAIGRFLIDRWMEAVDAHEEHLSRPPQLHNTDGDPLLLISHSFAFDPENRQEIENRLTALEGVEAGVATEQESEILFVRDAVEAADRTVLGRAIIDRDGLWIDTDSENRVMELRRRVLEACAGLLRDEKRFTPGVPSLLDADKSD